MSLRADFDVGPLSWVKGEIDLAMQRGLESLRAFAANPHDNTRIKVAQAHLHQAHGALQIVGLDGVTRVTEEIEALLTDLGKGPKAQVPQNFELAEEAFAGILGYLDSLIAGSPNHPLRLFNLYRRLLAARGRPDADPVDLYFPDLSGQPTPEDRIAAGHAPEALGKHYREQRSRFQRGLLRWFKDDASGAEDMRAAVEATELVQTVASQRVFWWVALAFFDALAAKALPEGADAKRLCSRIDQQFRRLVNGSQNVAERLLRETLYQIAHARAVTPHIMAVQEAYHLERTLPQEDGLKTSRAEPAALRPAREALAQAKDTWNRFASGHPPSLIAFRSAIGALKDRAAELGNPDVAGLARELAVLATWLASNASKMSEAIALEVATALLLLEDALSGLASLGADFTQQSEFVCARLKACVLGKLLRTAPTIPLLDEMSRKAQERLVLSQVVAEIEANLRSIEQVLDAFFRDPARRGDLALLSGPLHQVKGALEMLGESRARDVLGECEAEIGRFGRADYTSREEDFERIAQMLSGLEFYIEALAAGKADFDAAMRPIGAKRAPVEGESAAAQPSVEAGFVQQKREAQDLIQEWKKKPTDTRLKGELQKNLAAMREDASLVADAGLESQAQQALEQAVPEREMPAPSAETTRFIDASAEEINGELLGIYLEEAEEILGGVLDQLELVRARQADGPALTTIWRAFHTLRGGGRMVGLARLGEAAWAVEQTMNLWLQEERAATPGLLSLISVAHDYFAENVARLKAGGGSSDESALIELAAQVKRGEPLMAPEATAAELLVAPAVAASAPPGEEFVAIGEEKASESPFTMFAIEARSHLDAMTREREVLRQQAVITDALIRAAHTLAGISATAGMDAVRDLAHELEQALERLAAESVSQDEDELIGETIGAVSAMVEQAVSGARPLERPDLIARLRRAGVPALVESSASVMLPEEEGALARDAEAVPAPPEPSGAQPQP